MLYIGNPTNIIVAQTFNLNFFQYTIWMISPCVISGITSYIVLYLYFKKELHQYPETSDLQIPAAKLTEGNITIGIKVTSLISCLVSLGVTSFFNVSLWRVTLPFAGASILLDAGIDTHRHMRKSYRKSNGFTNIEDSDEVIDETQSQPRFGKLNFLFLRLPWKIIPFIMGMFILVDACKGWAEAISYSVLVPYLRKVNENYFDSVFMIGFWSITFCQLINNQPMYYNLRFSNILIVTLGRYCLQVFYDQTPWLVQ
jgi:arsenical pump membrane protein